MINFRKIVSLVILLWCLFGVQQSYAGLLNPRIAAGYYHSVVLQADSTVVMWGDNTYGQTIIPAGLVGVTGVAAGGRHTVVVRSDGTVVAWGFNLYGQTTVPVGLTGVVAVAAGVSHSVALKNDGTIVTWGANTNGETTIPTGLVGVTGIAAGSNHTVVVKNDSTVVAWGFNFYGQITVPVGLTGVVAVAAGASHSVALKNDGTVVAWGRGDLGQTTIPVGLTGVVAIAAGSDHTVALKNDGTVVAWGVNSNGQTTIPVGLTGVVAIAAGGSRTIALKSDGTVVAWGGANFFGENTIPAGLIVLEDLFQGSFGLEELNLTATSPANIAIQFRAFDSNTLLPIFNLSQIDFVVTEDGLPLSVESYYEVKHEGLDTQIETILMLDISSSINTLDLQTMKTAAKAVFIDANGNSLLLPGQKMAVYIFDDTVTMIQAATADPRTLEAAVNSIVSRNKFSTNLYGAIVEGMAGLVTGASLDTVFAGQMVMITDGRDTSGLHSLAQAQAAIGSNLLYVIGVQSPDLDVPAINALTSNYTPITNFADIEIALRSINQDIQNYANSFYQVLYTTPARGGLHTLDLSVAGNLNFFNANASISSTYDATGFYQPVVNMLVKGSDTMGVGSVISLETITRYAALDPYAYTWSIDNSALATLVQDVSNGALATLTAHAAGMVQVTVQDVRYPNLSYVHTVAIGDIFMLAGGVPETSLAMTEGDVLPIQAQLPADYYTLVAPNYTWVIADTSVASLNFISGSDVNITALASGSTTIMLTDVVSGRTTTIPITVTAIPPAIGGGNPPAGSTTPNPSAGGGCLAFTSHNISYLLWLLVLFGVLINRKHVVKGFRR